MRKSLILGVLFLVASCTIQKEKDYDDPGSHRYHAVVEEPDGEDTRVYADSRLRVHWNEEDHISIFERTTYNQEYEFLGDTGDTSGDFDPIANSGYHTGGDIEDGHVYAIYPYEKKNKCDYDGKMTVTFPSVQHYKQNSFGIGANIMVAKTNTTDLRFKHVGGYRTLRLYGAGVTVSSVKLESNGPEFLSGRTDVTIGSDGKPSVAFIESATNSKSVDLVCDTPVTLGSTASDYVEFWFVLPPGVLTEGFTITITDSNGNTFTKSTSNAIEIQSGVKKNMSAFEVIIEGGIQPNSVVYYTSTDGNTVTPYKSDGFGANLLSNEYRNGQGILTFDGDVASIGDDAFHHCDKLATISMPNSITEIGDYAFSRCSGLESITIPEHVVSIGRYAFEYCTSITTITIPESVETIGSGVFAYCSSLRRFEGKFATEDGKMLIVTENGRQVLKAFADPDATSIRIAPDGIDVDYVDSYVFAGHLNLQSVYSESKGYGDHAFIGCTSVTELTVMQDYLDNNNVIHYSNYPFGYLNNWFPSLENLVILSNVGGVEINMTSVCLSNLESITLPNYASLSDAATDLTGLSTGCQIYGPNASSDHACWILAGDLQLFAFPSNVTSYRLPSSVTRISAVISNIEKTWPDSYTNPDKSIYIPSSVTSILSVSHIWQPGLSVYMEGATPPTMGGVRALYSDPAIVYVKSAYYSAYQSAWSSFLSDSGNGWGPAIELRTY